MPTPGPNDIKAAFIVEDQASATLKQIDREASKATKTLEDKGKRATKTFDAMNFALNLATKGLKLLFQTLSQNQDFKNFTDAFREFAANQFDFSWAKSFTNSLSESNAEEKLQKLIDKKNELIRASMATDSDGELIASPSEVEALKLQWRAMNDEIEIVGNAMRMFKRLSIETRTASPAGFWETFFYGEGATDVKVETEHLIDFGDAYEAARIKQKKWKDDVKKADEDKKREAEAWKEFYAAIEEDNRRAAEAAKKAWDESLEGGWSNAVKDLEDEFLVAGKAADRFAKEAHNTISTNLFDAVTGKAVTFASFMTSILNSMLRQTTDAAAAALLGAFGGGGSGGIISGIGSLFGSGGSGGIHGSSIGSTYGNFGSGVEGGGIISGAGTLPEFAGGGIASGPSSGYLAVLHGTEKIEPMGGRKVAGLDRVGGGTVININLSAIDGRSAADFLASPEAQKRIGDAVIRAASTRMDLRRALK